LPRSPVATAVIGRTEVTIGLRVRKSRCALHFRSMMKRGRGCVLVLTTHLAPA
jgi:hypothetical protein